MGMYPRGVQELDPCRECRGTGKILNEQGRILYECTSCNGTGIEGKPGCGFLLMLISSLITMGAVAYFI